MDKSVLSVLRPSMGCDEFPLFREFLRQGFDLTNVDDRNYAFFEATNFPTRLARRLVRRSLETEFNQFLIRNLNRMKPELFFAFKAPSLSAGVVKTARELGTRVVVFYPDLDPSVYGKDYLSALSMADLLLHAKPNRNQFFSTQVNPNSQCVGPLYDSENVISIDEPNPEIGVCFVGHFSPQKLKLLTDLSNCYDGRISIFGNGWTQERFLKCRADVRVNKAIYGSAVAKIYREAICLLGFLQEGLVTGHEGDQVTSRTIVVPSNGGLLFHQSNPAARRIYGQLPSVLFESMPELVEKINNVSRDPKLRRSLATRQQNLAIAAGTSQKDLLNRIILK